MITNHSNHTFSFINAFEKQTLSENEQHDQLQFYNPINNISYNMTLSKLAKKDKHVKTVINNKPEE
jgi:hypothetical protein